MDKQERIDRAVVELDGQWPKDDPETYHILVDVSSTKDHDGESYNAWGDGWVGHRNGWFSVCTYPEFMEARARLKNKPTEWPEGADFLVQNSSGTWQFGRCNGAKVEPGKAGWRIKSVQDVEFLSPVASVGHVFGDWRQSLERRPESKEGNTVDKIDWSKAPEGYDYWIVDNEGDVDSAFHKLSGNRYYSEDGTYWPAGASFIKDGTVSVYSRPQPDHKEGDGVEWEPGVDLPPVGTVCEVDDGFKGWRKCEIIAHFEQPAGMVAVFTVGDTGTGKRVDFYGPTCFRPIQSDREKVIEALCEIANKPSVSSRNVSLECSVANRALIEAIADSGLVSLEDQK